MLARRLIPLLPPPSEEEAIEIARIHSTSTRRGGDAAQTFGMRPFREPHHTASSAAIVGGGRALDPGEISLAHKGVLFLDELPEFDRRVLEGLREPLESNEIVLVRANARVTYPARFQLIAAMNPCPVGRVCSATSCTCSPQQQRRYQTRISSPLLDRIDLHVHVPAVPHETLLSPASALDEPLLKDRVASAHTRQLARAGKANRDLGVKEIERDCVLSESGAALLNRAAGRLELSARGCHRVLRVARTIADLEGEARIREAHLAEALTFRTKNDQR
jgi:magnesium chelatase family protein